MAITYKSAHDSPEDPGGLIKQAIDMGAEFPGPAEDLLLAWTLRLGDDMDARDAAVILIDRYDIAAMGAPAGAVGKLVALIRETASAPRTSPCHPRRRGGWRRNRQAN